VAVLAALAACLGGLLAVIGEVAAAVVAAFAAGFGSFLSIVGEVARVVICHVFFSSMDRDFHKRLKERGQSAFTVSDEGSR